MNPLAKYRPILSFMLPPGANTDEKLSETCHSDSTFCQVTLVYLFTRLPMLTYFNI